MCQLNLYKAEIKIKKKKSIVQREQGHPASRDI